VDGGRIILTPAEELRLLSEAVRLRVLEPVKLERVPKKLREIAEKIRPQESMEAIKISSAKVDSEDLPPCIRRVLSLVEAGEASHNIMFILGTYLVGRGMNTDEAVEVFRRFPSFSEEKARYQLSFLSGEKGGTKYSCPSCAKIKSYNLCEWDCGVKHPLNYKKKGV
jgi:DNA primase large subunit